MFCEVAYKATTRQDMVDGIDEYIDDLTVLPPSIWDPSTRLEPPEKTIKMVRMSTGHSDVLFLKALANCAQLQLG